MGNQDIDIVNVVASAQLGREIDREHIDADIPYESHIKEQPPSLNIVIDDFEDSDSVDNPLVSLFRTGSINYIGLQTEEQAKQIHHQFMDELSDLDTELVSDGARNSFEIVHKIGHISIDKTIHLTQLAGYIGLDKIEYEPEQFSGLFVFLDEYDFPVMIVFSSGEIIAHLNGTDITEAQKDINHFINTYLDIF